MRASGHEIFFAVTPGGGLVERARAKGFTVYELSFKKHRALFAISTLLRIFRSERIDLINTHSSLDSWLAGIAARLAKKKVVRTRHLSTPIRGGLNRWLLYRVLTDFVVTTSKQAAERIQGKSLSVPTGVDTREVRTDEEGAKKFRESIGVKPEEILVGTLCFVRSWKGIKDFLNAVALLREEKNLKWMVVGGGYVEEYKPIAKELGIEKLVTFTGHLEPPFAALRAMDIFALLSTAHEGVSQACLQAAYLERPLLTTPVGGLAEVCLHEQTGLVVPPFSPASVAEAVLRLKNDPVLRKKLGAAAHKLVTEKYTWDQTLHSMERIYQEVRAPS